MKNLLIILRLLPLVFVINKAKAQKDIIYKKDSTQIRCKILKEDAAKYQYAFTDSVTLKVYKTQIAKTLVDSIKYNVYDTNLVQNKIYGKEKKQKKPAAEAVVEVKKNWKFTTGIGFNLGNLLEFNNPSGPDKKSFDGSTAIDLGLNFNKDGSRFAMTNELHYLLSLQKNGLTSAAHIQRASDNLNTLHDFSVAIGKTKKWNFNVIAKTTTSVFTIFNGDFFKDFNSLGKIQSSLSPYDVTLSPGIKWQPNQYLRVSISPYSFNMYGVKDNQIRGKGIFITDVDASGNFKKFLFKRLGAEINIWYDRQIKEWLTMQYRVGISSNVFEKIAKNGLLDGQFITKFKLIKNVYLTHRATLKGDFSQPVFKPFYSQTIMLSFAKNF